MMLSEKTNLYKNNFDFLRFTAALMVLLSHSFPTYGLQMPFLVKVFEPGAVAVFTFFIISGFLITKSWQDNPNFFIFIKKRFLRIFPGFMCMLIFVTLIIGSLTTTLSLKDYFFHSNAYKYILQNMSLITIQNFLPGVFEHNPFARYVNGSLWSLPVEIFMYELIALFGIFKLLSKKYFIVAFIALLFITYNFIYADELSKFLWLPAKATIRVGIFFFIGSLMYLYREKIKLSSSFFATCVLFFLISLNTDYTNIIRFITLPYIIIYLAYAKIPLIDNWGKYGDFSYGLYIYASPIQQTISYFYRTNINFYEFIGISFILTLFLAILSWYIIEKNALKLKKINFREQIFNMFNNFYPIEKTFAK